MNFELKTTNYEFMSAHSFEETPVWKKSKQLVVGVYRVFKDLRDYSFKDQITRAALSITNNIAEGMERKGDKELHYFLTIAKGSCGEVRSMLIIANELKMLQERLYTELYSQTEEVGRMLGGFMKSLRPLPIVVRSS